MSCNCKTEIEARLVERYKSLTTDATDHSATLEGYGLGIANNTMVVRPLMTVKYGASHTTKSGEQRWKNRKGTVVFNFCPFCGVKIGGAA